MLLDPLPDVTAVRIPAHRALHCDLCGVPILHGVAGLVDHYKHQHRDVRDDRIRCAHVFSSKRRCSNTAMVGGYCYTHAPIHGGHIAVNDGPYPKAATEP